MITKALSRLGICPDYCHWLPAIGVTPPMWPLALAGHGASGGGRVLSVLGMDDILCGLYWLSPFVPCENCWCLVVWDWNLANPLYTWGPWIQKQEKC